MDLVKDHHAGAHTVPSLGVVGAALDHAPVFPPLHQLLCVVVKPLQLCFALGKLQRVHQIQHRRHGLLLVIGADVYVVVAHRIVGRGGAHRDKCDKSVLSRATANHGKQGFPPGPSVSGVGAHPKRRQKLLPQEKVFIREIAGQTQVPPKLLCIHPQIFDLEAPPDMRRQGVLLRAGPGLICLHCLQIRRDRWRQLTAHRLCLPARPILRRRP